MIRNYQVSLSYWKCPQNFSLFLFASPKRIQKATRNPCLTEVILTGIYNPNPGSSYVQQLYKVDSAF